MTGDETGEQKNTIFIPRSIRDKNPVRCSDDVKEDSRIVAAMQRAASRHETYKREQAADIHTIAKIEITILKEKINLLFLQAAYTYAKIIHVMETTKGPFATLLELADAAHLVVLLLIRSIRQLDAAILHTTSQQLLKAYSDHHGINTSELEKKRTLQQRARSCASSNQSFLPPSPISSNIITRRISLERLLPL